MIAVKKKLLTEEFIMYDPMEMLNKEEDELSRRLNEGEITVREYNEMLRDLEESYGDIG